MIYIFEGSYWRTLCLSQHTSVLRLLWYIVIEKPVYLYKYILVRTCDQVGLGKSADTSQLANRPSSLPRHEGEGESDNEHLCGALDPVTDQNVNRGDVR